MPNAVFLCFTRFVSRCSLLLVCLLVGTMPNRSRGESLDRQLLIHAPQVLKYCQAHGYEHVGVLKFCVQKGQSALTDNVGPLNLDMAAKLELALVLANRVQDPVGIIHDASAVAAAIPGANHVVATGRPPLFTRRYPLAWGDEQVAPDAFLTGVVRVSDDLQQLAVEIAAFGRDNAMKPVVEFEADVDPFDLIDAGESFLVRGGLENDEQQLAQVVKSANQVRKRSKPHPLQDLNSPIELEIRYDRMPIPIEFRDGEAFVREPHEGQQVSLVVKRRPHDQARYALVLKVNGLNTLYKQRLPELECSKWVSEPDRAEICIVGFQLTAKQVEAFKVRSRAESKEREMDYGADVGTISLVVFREGTIRPPRADELLDDIAEDSAVLSRERFPAETARNLPALKAQIHNDGTRGLITEGEVIPGAVRKVPFTPNPIPAMSATITYYHSD